MLGSSRHGRQNQGACEHSVSAFHVLVVSTAVLTISFVSLGEWVATVLPRIEAAGDESLLQVVPVASILGTQQPVADPAPLASLPSSPPEAPSSPVNKPQAYASLSQLEIDDFLDRPRTMMGVRFICSPPNAEDEELEGEWCLVAHASHLDEDQVLEEEYQVRLESFPDGPMPMGRDEVEYLLMFSRLSS